VKHSRRTPLTRSGLHGRVALVTGGSRAWARESPGNRRGRRAGRRDVHAVAGGRCQGGRRHRSRWRQAMSVYASAAEEQSWSDAVARSSIASAMSTYWSAMPACQRGLPSPTPIAGIPPAAWRAHAGPAGVDSPTAAGHAGQGRSDIVVISSDRHVCRPTRRPTPWPRPPWRRHAGYWP